MSTTIPLSDLLRKGDWLAVGNFFAHTEPSNAEQFQARALLRIEQGKRGIVQWHEVMGDLRQASQLEPKQVAHRANLAQALIDSGQSHAAIEELNKALGAFPGEILLEEKLAIAAMEVGQWELAVATLTRLKQIANGVALRPPLEGLYVQLGARWWEPIGVGKVNLVQPRQEDLSFLKECVANDEFMRLFHRQKGSDLESLNGLLHQGRRSPFKTHNMGWVVYLNEKLPVGLTGLVDIDWGHKRAEMIIGFPKKCGTLTAIQTTYAVIHFAFYRLGLEKLVAFIYTENEWAHRNALRIGFLQEGVLRGHVVSNDRRLDVCALGLLRNEWIGSQLFFSLSRRWNRHRAEQELKALGTAAAY